MGRKQRNDADYFPHFATQGKTLFILKSRFGNDGYAFWFQLLELLCRSDGHCYDCNKPSDWQYLLSCTGVTEESGTEILRLLADLEKIDPDLWHDRIIWCQNLVTNIEVVYKKRGRTVPVRPTSLRTTPSVSVPEKTEVATPTEISGSDIPHSKVEYSKVNNIPPIIPLTENDTEKKPKKKAYGEFKNVLLTEDEYVQLHDRFNQQTPALIDRLSTYIASTGKKYKSHYATILSWVQRDEKEGKSGKTRHSRDLPKTYTPSPVYPDD